MMQVRKKKTLHFFILHYILYERCLLYFSVMYCSKLKFYRLKSVQIKKYLIINETTKLSDLICSILVFLYVKIHFFTTT